MQCERLISLIKSWYGHVRDETMAPARMVGFIEQHAESCEICRQDPDLKDEIAKITELILPESKIPKAVRAQNNKLKEAEEAEHEGDEETEDDLDNEDLDDDEEEPIEIDAAEDLASGSEDL